MSAAAPAVLVSITMAAATRRAQHACVEFVRCPCSLLREAERARPRRGRRARHRIEPGEEVAADAVEVVGGQRGQLLGTAGGDAGEGPRASSSQRLAVQRALGASSRSTSRERPLRLSSSRSASSLIRSCPPVRVAEVHQDLVGESESSCLRSSSSSRARRSPALWAASIPFHAASWLWSARRGGHRGAEERVAVACVVNYLI